MKSKMNIVIIGMPGSGKSSISKELSKISKRDCFETDEIIEKQLSKSIPCIFKEYGEKYFREKEKQVINEVSKKEGIIISTGGGCVLYEENYISLSRNSKIYYIIRPLHLLDIKARPLSVGGLESLKKIYQVRSPLYKKFADVYIKNITIQDSVMNIWRDFNENFGN